METLKCEKCKKPLEKEGQMYGYPIYEGSPCRGCRAKEEERIFEEKRIQKENEILERAKQAASRLNITLAEAILLVK
jgi:hypothetical protein